jgi:DNA-binding response OmpR family regulator
VTVSYEYTVQSEMQSQVTNISDIRWDAEHRTVVIGNVTVTLTPIQYRLLFPLRQGKAVTYTDLARMVYHCEVDEKVRMMMDKHIDRLRRKLRGTGIYIYCVMGYGYLLLDELETE